MKVVGREYVREGERERNGKVRKRVSETNDGHAWQEGAREGGSHAMKSFGRASIDLV